MSKQTSTASNIPHESDPANPVTITASPDGAVDSEEVARRAYTHWHARGCPDGSPEEDWFLAEQEVNGIVSRV